MVDEMVTIVVDFGGRVEALRLMSQSQGTLRDVLLTHNDNATAIMENKFWKGMLLIPWANRIAYVSPQECISGTSRYDHCIIIVRGPRLGYNRFFYI
jgi:hypothetical protein